MSFCIRDLIFQKGGGVPQSALESELQYNIPIWSSALLSYFRGKMFVRVTNKGCCHFPSHFIITLFYLFTSIWKRRQTTTQPHKNAHILLCWLWSLSPVPVQPALEGVEVRCNLVLRPLLVILCQYFKLEPMSCWSVEPMLWSSYCWSFPVFLCFWVCDHFQKCYRHLSLALISFF